MALVAQCINLVRRRVLKVWNVAPQLPCTALEGTQRAWGFHSKPRFAHLAGLFSEGCSSPPRKHHSKFPEKVPCKVL